MYDRAKCLGFQMLTLSATAASGLTIPASGFIQYANAALIRVEGNNARYLMTGATGANPSATAGFPIYTTDTAPLWLNGLGLLQNFKAIATTGTATLNVLYFGSGM